MDNTLLLLTCWHNERSEGNVKAMQSGTRVKCISPEKCQGTLTHGQVYVVVEVFNWQGVLYLQIVDDEGYMWDYPAEMFEKVE
jgi:hypothetical protein